jgi:hypothetical protein
MRPRAESITYRNSLSLDSAISIGAPPVHRRGHGIPERELPVRVHPYEESVELAVFDTNAILPSAVSAIQQVAA